MVFESQAPLKYLKRNAVFLCLVYEWLFGGKVLDLFSQSLNGGCLSDIQMKHWTLMYSKVQNSKGILFFPLDGAK